MIVDVYKVYFEFFILKNSQMILVWINLPLESYVFVLFRYLYIETCIFCFV